MAGDVSKAAPGFTHFLRPPDPGLYRFDQPGGPRPAHQMAPPNFYTNQLEMHGGSGTGHPGAAMTAGPTGPGGHFESGCPVSQMTGVMTSDQMSVAVSRPCPVTSCMPASCYPGSYQGYAHPAAAAAAAAAVGSCQPPMQQAAVSAAAAAAAAQCGTMSSPGVPPGMHFPPMPAVHEMDCDPRELEAFAERFKQRRIKLGVTQCDVGKALANLKLPGVGSLSQSTICRFESLTLSHNNMIALKPVLEAWLKEAEQQAAELAKRPDIYGDSADKKRKRTSITDAEKRSLEAYFAVQPRPSSEKIAQIAEKLYLKKNVVRVWFCNQRQKQKRMKFASAAMLGTNLV